MARKPTTSTRKSDGLPTRMATPITVADPSQRGVYDAVLGLSERQPTDSLGFCGPTRRTKKER